MFDSFIPVGLLQSTGPRNALPGCAEQASILSAGEARLIPGVSAPPPPKQERAGRIASALDTGEGNFKQAECNHPNWNPARTL